MSVRATLLLGLPLTLVAAAPFGYGLTTQRRAAVPPAEIEVVDERKAGEKLCASRIVNERLKARVFDDAAVVGSGMSANLDLLASFSEVRMEQPLLKSRDQNMGVTVCTGRFVLLLPPGAERGFGGMRLLSADVEYAALKAADGSGLVYQLKGADPIVYRLAAFNMRASRMPEEMEFAQAPEVTAEPVLAPPVAPLPIQAPVTAPEPAPPDPPKPVVEKPAKLVQAEPRKAEAPAPKLAKAEPKKIEAPKPKLAKAEPKKTEQAKPKLARSEPKPAREKVKTAEAKKPVPAAKKTAVAETKAKPAKKEKLAAVAAPKKAAAPTPEKLAAVAPKKAVAPKPKPQALAAAKPKVPAVVKPVPVVAGSSENSFLNYEKRKAAAPAKPIETAVEDKPLRPTPIAAVQPRRDACADADGAEARLVCTNPGLRAKQRTVADIYYAALRDADGQTRRELTGSRSRFASYVSRCGSASCLANAYDDRMAEIRDIMAQY